MTLNLFNNFERSMIVAMIAMGVVKSSINQIINVVPMRDSRMPAVGAMNMFGLVFGNSKARSAFVGIGGVDGNLVFIHMVSMGMMQMAIMKIIRMSFMLDCSMSTARTVDMRMICVSGARMCIAHNFYFQICVFARFIESQIITIVIGAARNVSASGLH
ncbi:MAG TPA: hypothetical protein VMH87_16975 [Pseudomonadales bacterium]|nr:hypothetical protein [Pseudomonadales bacterium]